MFWLSLFATKTFALVSHTVRLRWVRKLIMVITIAMVNLFSVFSVSATKTTKARELKKAIGVITVEFTRETRPYKVTQAVDPVAQKPIPISEAVERGIFDQDRQTYTNIETGNRDA